MYLVQAATGFLTMILTYLNQHIIFYWWLNPIFIATIILWNIHYATTQWSLSIALSKPGDNKL